MTGKVAIVTAGAQAIGAGLVAAYRARGWTVVVNAGTFVSPEDPQVIIVDGDLSEPATADRIVGAALGRFGRIDTLVNTAGVCIAKPFTDYTADDYAAGVGGNLTGFFWLTQRTITEMLKRYGGHVVNVAGSATPTVLAALTKGAVAAATRSLAIEYAAYGIRVNAVAPGLIETPVDAPENDPLPPIGHAGQVRDVVNGVMFLESSPFITGEILHVDGGRVAGH
jgi:NAD(P)-dependent dehydrogenase (short-subunit alcohol dehydrogenase family)